MVIMACTKLFNPCSLACRAAINWGSLLTIFSAGKGTPMIPVEDGNTSSGFTPSRRAGFAADLPAGAKSGRTGGAVGVSRVHRDRPHPASAGLERRPANLQRCGYDSVPGEDGSGRGSSTGFNQRQIRASAGFDPSRDRRKSKAFRQKCGVQRSCPDGSYLQLHQEACRFRQDGESGQLAADHRHFVAANGTVWGRPSISHL